MNKIKNIGVLTSGGDAPGMNAAIRAVVRAGKYYGLNVFGVKRGYTGLINGDMEELSSRSVSGILKQGGTILKTARSADFMTEVGQKKALSMAGIFNLDALVVIGGDGSYRGARAISNLGLPIIGLPGTIDNDIACTDYTIGYDTAMNTALDAIDKIHDTAYSHERCSLLEVMGRHAGYIAMMVGIAGGAEVIIIPEKELNLEADVLRPIVEARNHGKTDYIVVLAEGVGDAFEIANTIKQKTDIEARVTILGHVQRGGSPSVYDRFIASMMGVKAIELLKDGIVNRIVSIKSDKVVDIEVNEALEMTKSMDPEWVHVSKILSI